MDSEDVKKFLENSTNEQIESSDSPKMDNTLSADKSFKQSTNSIEKSEENTDKKTPQQDSDRPIQEQKDGTPSIEIATVGSEKNEEGNNDRMKVGNANQQKTVMVHSSDPASKPENTDCLCCKCGNLLLKCSCALDITKKDDCVREHCETSKAASIDASQQESSNKQLKDVEAQDTRKEGDDGQSNKEENNSKPAITKQPTTSWSSLGVKRCENCKFTTSDEAIFNSHSVICTPKGEKCQVRLVYASTKYRCSNCLFETSLRKKFEEHVALHLMVEPYICMNCNITFESKKDIEVHVKSKHSNESVKCGLKGSKRISQIVEQLHSSGKHLFTGRTLNKPSQQTNSHGGSKPSQQSNTVASKSNATAEDGNPPATSTNASTSSSSLTNVSKAGLQQNEPDVIFISSSASSKTVVPQISSKSAAPLITYNQPQIQSKTSVVAPTLVTQQPVLLFPLSNNIFVPISNVSASQKAPNVITTMQQRPVIPSSTMPNQFVNIAPTPAGQNNIIIRGGNIQTSQIRQTVSSSSINVPSNTHVSSTIPNTPNQTRYYLIPTQSAKPMQSINNQPSQIIGPVPNIVLSNGQTPSAGISYMNSVPVLSNKPILTSAVLHSKTDNYGDKQLPSTLTSPANIITSSVITPTSVYASTSSHVPSTCLDNTQKQVLENSFATTDTKSGNKLFFRKYGELYICDFCKSETPLEDSFKEHIWKHFHQMQNICKECPTTYNSVKQCNIVSRVILGLQSSSVGSQSLLLNSSQAKDNIKKDQTVQEVVMISDDEEDNVESGKTETKSKLNENKRSSNVVGFDSKTTREKSSEVDSGNSLDIKITSAFSLTNVSKDDETDGKGSNEKESDSNQTCLEKIEMSAGDKPICIDIDSQISPSEKGEKVVSSVENSVTNVSVMTDQSKSINDSSLVSMILNGPNNDSASGSDSAKPIDDSNKTETKPEIDRKPIALPLVAFYKCGFSGCTFDSFMSHDFRDHLNQVHNNATEYKCAHCGQKSFTEDSHIRHLLFHSKPQNTLLFQCSVIGCRFKANLLHVYKEHLEQTHQNVLFHRCHSCKDGFNSVDGLVEHLQMNLLKFVQCPYCTMKDGLRRNVVSHIAKHHPGKPRQINVTSQLVCQERESNEFEKMKQVTMPQDTVVSMDVQKEKEIKTEPNSNVVENDPEDIELIKRISSNSQIMGATYFKCKFCTYIGIGQAKLNKHIELHTAGHKQNQRVFVCPECPQSTNTLQQFISHLNLHIGGHVCNIYTCQHCGFGTNMSNKIHHHISANHEISLNANSDSQDYTQRIIKFTVDVTFCKDCKVAFKSKSAHRDHVLKTHGITTDESSGTNSFETQHSINKSLNLESPPECEEDHPRRFTCNECGWGTKKLSYLKSHIKRHYPGQDRTTITLFKCNYCEYTSTSKLIISSHSQKGHVGKPLKVRRVVETVYITDTPEDDMSIDKFHCDLCSFSSDKISGLQNHLVTSHSESKMDYQEEKATYSGPKQQFVIPFGTVFRDFVGCSLCSFKTKKRIDLLRHIKTHPSLECITETAPDIQNAERNHNPLFESFHKLGNKRKNSSDGNGVFKKARPSSPTIDYDRILMDSAKRDTGFRKQVATKSTTNRLQANAKAMLYHLGGDQLHMKLKPCFSEFKQSPKYTCLICSDVFDDKCALHKHILNHMNVYFYKCSYCDYGTLDSTSIMVHIQRVHRKSIQYNKLDVEEIDSHVNKAIHHMKSQVSDGKSQITFEEMAKKLALERPDQPDALVQEKQKEQSEDVKQLKDDHIVPTKNTPSKNRKMPVNDKAFARKADVPDILSSSSENENVNIENSSPKNENSFPKKENSPPKKENSPPKKENPSPKKEILQQKSPIKLKNPDKKDANTPIIKKERPSPEKPRDEIGVKKDEMLHPRLKRENDTIVCTLCDFSDPSKAAASKHIIKHSSVRRFMCSICLHNYVSRWRGDVTKHIDTKHKTQDAECLWDDVSPDDITYDGKPFNSVSNIRYLSDFQAIDVKKKSLEKLESPMKDENKQSLKIKLSLTNVHGNQAEDYFQGIYKCLVCSETFKTKYAIFKHFRICKNPLFGCNLCKFKNASENEARAHIKHKHEGNAEVIELTIRRDKIRMYKVPDRKIFSKEENSEQVQGSVSFKCIACKRSFKTRNACLYHAISPICKKVVKKCSSCDFTSVSDEEIEGHIKMQHKGTNATAVELPKDAKVEMVRTQSTKKLRVDSSGKITFFSKVNGTYVCALCDFKTKMRSNLVQHQNMHQASPAYGCPYCEMKSNWTKSIRNHIHSRHPNKKVKCLDLKDTSIVDKFKQSDPNERNTQSKSKEGGESQRLMHKCLQCSYKCNSYSSIYRHIKRTESCNVPRFKCNKCIKFTSINEQDVKDHMKKVHNSQDNPEVCLLKEMTKLVIVKKKSKISNDSSESSEKKTDSRVADRFSDLKDVETKIITCPAISCSYKDTALKVIEHYRKKHPYKVARCKMCPLSSKSLGILFKHFQDFHKLEDYLSTNFIVCSASRDELKERKKEEGMEGKSNAQKKFNCDRCEYGTKIRNDMKRHIYRHLNYKRFSCRLCKSDFLEQLYCENHLSQIHNTDAEEFDEIKNERLEKEVEEIIDRNISYKVFDEDVDVKSRKFTSISESSLKKKPAIKREKSFDNSTKPIDFTSIDPNVFNPSAYIEAVDNSKTNATEYLCTKCPFKSILRSSSSRHSYKHMPKCMKCPYCNFHDYPRADVTKHIRTKHRDKAIHVVDLRHEKSESKTLAKRHKKPKLSLFDAEVYTSEGSSDEENHKEHGKDNLRSKQTNKSCTGDTVKKTMYRCNICDYTSDVLYLYRQHLTLHPGFTYQIQGTSLESKNKCGYCGYIATSGKEFDAHMERHLNSRPYNCPYCQFSQYTHSSVRNHVIHSHPNRKVEVLKDSSSSFLTGDGKVPKTMLVNFEPRVRLADIFTMESELFENLLIGANVNVIDLHSIPDDQFGNVSKLLGVSGEDVPESPYGTYASDDNANDVVDGSCDTDLHVEDESDAETRIADDESQMDCSDLSDVDEKSTSVKKEPKDKNLNKLFKTSVENAYEDISDTEMDCSQFVTNNGEKFIVKSELTYEDISDEDL